MIKGDAFRFLQAEIEHVRFNAPPFTSFDEGYREVQERVNDLLVAIKSSSNEVLFKEVRKEAAGVAAQALRFLIDLC